MDALLSGYQSMVCHCVVERTQFSIPYSMDTMDLVLVSTRWGTVQNRTSILMTPRLQELRIRALATGLDAIKKHIQSGNLGTACERLLATYQELKTISRRRKKQS